jgi:hypothetical protein
VHDELEDGVGLSERERHEGPVRRRGVSHGGVRSLLSIATEPHTMSAAIAAHEPCDAES